MIVCQLPMLRHFGPGLRKRCFVLPRRLWRVAMAVSAAPRTFCCVDACDLQAVTCSLFVAQGCCWLRLAQLVTWLYSTVPQEPWWSSAGRWRQQGLAAVGKLL
jgi:hypothetical protein